MKTGNVSVFTQPNVPLEFREYPVPAVADGDLLVKIRMANICGSDLHIWRGHGSKIPRGIPQVLGHEMVGTIEQLGKNVRVDSTGEQLEEGDRIAYSYFKPCNQCWMCLSGKPGCPARYRDWIGVSSEQPPHFHGAYGEYYYMKPGHWIFKVPAELPDALVSPVNCALAQVIYGLNQIGITLGDTVVIQGAGGLGLYAIAVAKEMGAGQVVVLDRFPARLELAREFGADHLLNVDELSVADRSTYVLDHTGGTGADVIAEFVGSPKVLSEGIEMLRWGGRYLWIGNINLEQPTEIDPGNIVRCSKAIQGIIVYEPWVIRRALDFLSRTRDKYPYHKIISHTFPFSQINEAFTFANEGSAIRVGLEFGSTSS
jgi:D-arabinose 1-dehydrogenase-like Zn-dependent alcohol dehydrogenase